MTYKCHSVSVSVRYSTNTATVISAARRSHTSIVFFLSNRSVIAPAKMLMMTYGAYVQMVSVAVLSAEPVFSYIHSVRANAVMALPSCDRLCVLQRM